MYMIADTGNCRLVVTEKVSYFASDTLDFYKLCYIYTIKQNVDLEYTKQFDQMNMYMYLNI